MNALFALLLAVPSVTVGSKSFGESVILGEIAADVARSAGASVQHRRALGGTRLVWDALRAGAIDVYPDYTGTLAQEIMAGEARAGADWMARALVARGLALSGPLGFNDTYAIALRADVAARLGLQRISDLRAHPQLRFGFSSEFMSRRDGWPGLQARYQLPQQDVRGLEHDLAYRGLAAGDLDAIDVYTTDPEIAAQHLKLLEDDAGFFPRYDAVLVYRADLQQRAPAVVEALRGLEGRISAERMSRMNAQAKLDRVPEPAVAAAFVKEALGLRATVETDGPIHRIARHTIEHLWLVGLSLLLGILVAIPLGVVAARRPRLGQVVLAVVGVVQTIPSLALLVFMIPLFGIGTLPACVALFLYSLLPIVRNTVSGLSDIPPSLRESAEALGLSPGAILRLVELPLASRSILAGIKSAAVIDVGTATLGALIGAGGLGQPIFTGIRLNDFALLLEGAVPASVLALLVQGVFELVERVVVPRGLRLKPE
jgi:osmoprotectant transport system substrate-binding protein/osmoprotectant transport system permease protein